MNDKYATITVAPTATLYARLEADARESGSGRTVEEQSAFLLSKWVEATRNAKKEKRQ